MIYRASSLPGDNPGFSDLTDPAERQIVDAVVRAGIAGGNSGRFEPRRPLTRSEAAIMLSANLGAYSSGSPTKKARGPRMRTEDGVAIRLEATSAPKSTERPQAL